MARLQVEKLKNRPFSP